MGFPYDRVFVGRHTKYPVFFTRSSSPRCLRSTFYISQKIRNAKFKTCGNYVSFGVLMIKKYFLNRKNIYLRQNNKKKS